MDNKCYFCDEEASVRFVRIDAFGQMFELFSCPKHKPKTLEGGYDFFENTPGRKLEIALSHYFCPVCGCSKAWVEENKQLGCPKCYEIFSDFSKTFLKGYKNCPIFLGKIPKLKKMVSFSTLEEAYKPRLKYWETCKQSFIKAENFEAAQRYQKQIDRVGQEIEDASAHI